MLTTLSDVGVITLMTLCAFVHSAACIFHYFERCFLPNIQRTMKVWVVNYAKAYFCSSHALFKYISILNLFIMSCITSFFFSGCVVTTHGYILFIWCMVAYFYLWTHTFGAVMSFSPQNVLPRILRQYCIDYNSFSLTKSCQVKGFIFHQHGSRSKWGGSNLCSICF